MTRVVSVGRSKGFLLASTLGTVAFMSILAGCPGTLDPGQFPLSGSAGSTGAAGNPGMAGTSGGLPGCPNIEMVIMKTGCNIDGVCHGANPAANFDMLTAGWETHLVGQAPKGGGQLAPSICATDNAFKTIPYINAGTMPATGLLMTKLTSAACSPMGKQMPSGLPPLTPDQLKCFQDFANKLANP
jgi:hypothetical protein